MSWRRRIITHTHKLHVFSTENHTKPYLSLQKSLFFKLSRLFLRTAFDVFFSLKERREAACVCERDLRQNGSWIGTSLAVEMTTKMFKIKVKIEG